MALLNLFDPETGMPVALLDATAITEMRTGAVTALGAKYLARKDSRVLGHLGARGTAYWNVRLLNHLFPLDEIRVHSRRPESREPFAARLSRDLGREVKAVGSWQACLEGADIQVEASRLPAPSSPSVHLLHDLVDRRLDGVEEGSHLLDQPGVGQDVQVQASVLGGDGGARLVVVVGTLGVQESLGGFRRDQFGAPGVIRGVPGRRHTIGVRYEG